jgi:hypothetical protein
MISKSTPLMLELGAPLIKSCMLPIERLLCGTYLPIIQSLLRPCLPCIESMYCSSISLLIESFWPAVVEICPPLFQIVSQLSTALA